MGETTIRRLHLGCGPNVVQGWDNVDGSLSAWFAAHPRLLRLLASCGIVPKRLAEQPYPKGIRRHDLRGPLSFASSNSYDAVYASHILEHLTYAHAQQLLAETRRVLRPGGIGRFVVPDLRSLVLEYLGHLTLADESGDARSLDGADRFSARFLNAGIAPIKRSWLYRIYSLHTDLHHHKWMYDGPSLVRHMQRIGFADVTERGLYQSQIVDIRSIENPERLLGGNGVCVEGIKP
jgi:SAM-dependent methyltransferase